MHPRYPNIFSPIQLGPVELKNRFYSSPHAVPLNILGKPSIDFVHYNVARAKGGCGLVILSMSAHDRLRTVWPNIAPVDHIPAFQVLTEAVHTAGAKIFGEPWHFWSQPGFWNPFSPPAPALGPSPAQFAFHGRGWATREMTRDDIKAMQATYRTNAAHLREAGFDGIMVHLSHASIMEQFNSPYFNRRTDDYGGTFEKRMRFVLETLEAVQEGADGKIAVGIRMNCDELVKGGYNTEGAHAILKRIADSGLIDFADLDVAREPDQFWIGMPGVFVEEHVYKSYAEAVRDAAGKVPVMCVMGRITQMADAEAAIASGAFDMVGAARALIAEPEFVNLARFGREVEGRTCIACNWCLQSLLDEGSQTCTVNPTAWRERFWDPFETPLAPEAKKVVIVGGGPGGLEAAVTAKRRGHDVILIEARQRLGGALALWAELPGREFFGKAIDWWATELVRLGVEVRLGAEATAQTVLAEKPDAVIIATGAQFSREGRSNHLDQPIMGYDLPHVCTVDDVLLGRSIPKGKVVIIDGEGSNAGVGVAEILGTAGCEVHFLAPRFSPVSPRVNNAEETRFIVPRLKKAGVQFQPSTWVSEIRDGEVWAYDIWTNEERTMSGVDAVVLATSRAAENDLESALNGNVAQLFVIGDAAAARMWAAATYEGHMFARAIGEPGAPTNIGEAYFAEFDMASLPYPADMKFG